MAITSRRDLGGMKVDFERTVNRRRRETARHQVPTVVFKVRENRLEKEGYDAKGRDGELGGRAECFQV